jgi:hypothetical protein
VRGKYVQLGEVAVGSAVELSGTIMTPFGAYRGRMKPNAFENALFLWEAAQQCLHYISGAVANTFDPSSGRHVEAGGCGAGDLMANR